MEASDRSIPTTPGSDKIVYTGLVKADHHQYWLRDEVDPDVDTLYDNYDPGTHPLVAIDDSRHLACIQTGMYGFDLPVMVEVWKRPPEPDLDVWEEVIEFSLLLGEGAYVASLLTEDSIVGFDLPTSGKGAPGTALTNSYRIRLHATGRKQAEELEHISLDDGDEPVEKHLIQIWAAPPESVRWLKEHDDWPVWEPDTSGPRTDFYVETLAGKYWLADYSTGRHTARVSGRGNGVILPERGGHMAAVFTGEPASIVEVVKDILTEEPEPELDDWEEIAEVGMTFTGPYVTCNFLKFDTAPGSYQDLPAEVGQTRSYRVRISVKGRHGHYELVGRDPGDHRHAERHMIQIWPAPEGPEKIWKTHRR